jgi:hypothetical protein
MQMFVAFAATSEVATIVVPRLKVQVRWALESRNPYAAVVEEIT